MAIELGNLQTAKFLLTKGHAKLTGPEWTIESPAYCATIKNDLICEEMLHLSLKHGFKNI